MKEDNTFLKHLDDANILANMVDRYIAGRIYTYTASVLLAVNPHTDLPLYSKKEGEKNVIPHPFAIAHRCFKNLLNGNQSQSVVISGESGAGKTETAKKVMEYLAFLSRNEAKQVQQRILQANPILEAFGNVFFPHFCGRFAISPLVRGVVKFLYLKPGSKGGVERCISRYKLRN